MADLIKAITEADKELQTKGPTQEQVKKFWEKCGFTWWLGNYGTSQGEWRFPDGRLHLGKIKLDLNNLFKYAVPKVVQFGLLLSHSMWITGDNVIWYCTIVDRHIEVKYNDPALALFWAIYKVIK